jgi:ubiquinone/menaquinone biosynthesis C-methylase UbiE
VSSVALNEKLEALLFDFRKDEDGIYSAMLQANEMQSMEILMREKVAAVKHFAPLEHIARHHSIPVMDREIDIFLLRIPKNGLILDIGGCWGWHWRRLSETRPDVGVVIVDFIRGNLFHAQEMLGGLAGSQVALMHGDATALPFGRQVADSLFDGVWTVQTFQHIPDFSLAVSEAYRILKPGGSFACYSLNIQPPIQILYMLLGKQYVVEGKLGDLFWLARASDRQKREIAKIFRSHVAERWTEIIYSPELRFSRPGRLGSILGEIDARISNYSGWFRWFARQHSFHCAKAQLSGGESFYGVDA